MVNSHSIKNRFCSLLQKSINTIKKDGVRVFLKKAKHKLKSKWYVLDLKTRIPKGVRYLRKNGLKMFLLKLRMVLLNIQPNAVVRDESLHVVALESIPQSESLGKKIAVHLHLYYTDLADEFISYFRNIPFSFILLISVKNGEDKAFIKEKFSTLENATKIVVKETQNRGRDIAPLYVLFKNEIKQTDYFAHIHSKKSLYSGKERNDWRTYALNALFGSKELINKFFHLFEAANVGLIAPETFSDLPMIAQTWMSNVPKARQFFQELNIKFEDGYFNYPVGSFFWAKTDALRPLLEKDLKYSDFDEENGQTDGTLAHVLERAIAKVTEYSGYQQAFVDLDEERVSIGRSLKFLRSYNSINKEFLVKLLSEYDVISFDIFDTLVTRRILRPDDLFHVMSKKIKDIYSVDIDFLKVRKQAEARAWAKRGAKCNIDDIYEALPIISSEFTPDLAQSIKQMEIELEKSFIIPRRDMLYVFNELKRRKKKMILISDMYLPSKLIAEILQNCGFDSWDQLWVSCDFGKRKDDGTIWDEFFARYDSVKTIHVGDNPYSDCQVLLDKHKDYFAVLSSFEEFKLSSFSALFSKYDFASIESSYLMGCFINEGLFNSPFSLSQAKLDARTLGYVWFGPLCLKFAHWLAHAHTDDTGYLFLAREGYLIQKIYQTFCDFAKISQQPNIYCLASRRATSVAAIQSKDDLRGIIEQVYSGDTKNFLFSRFGLTMHENDLPEDLHIPGDENLVMQYFANHRDELDKRITSERKAYLSYLQNIKEELGVSNLKVVDVGYSGTIQYYLCRLLNQKIDGMYLITQPNKKPEKIGACCEAIYPYDSIYEMEQSKFFNMQLFLEGGFKAPYGQLIYFEMKNDVPIPCFKGDKEVDPYIIQFQEGIIRFVSDFGLCIGDCQSIDSALVREMYTALPEMVYIDAELCRAFQVQDDYCSNGNLVYNALTHQWAPET